MIDAERWNGWGWECVNQHYDRTIKPDLQHPHNYRDLIASLMTVMWMLMKFEADAGTESP